MDEGRIDFSVAMEIVDVIHKFNYATWPEDLSWLTQTKRDIAHSVVLFLSGRAENIYPVEPGVFIPGEIIPPKRRRIVSFEGRGADDDARER